MHRVAVFNTHRTRRLRSDAARWVRRVLQGEHAEDAEIRVIFVDAKRCIALNSKFLGHHYSTDVISFPLEEGSNLEGEIYVNLDKARSQADTYGVTFTNEVMRLVVHGTLHLVGYDDRRPAAAARMKQRENAYVLSLAGEEKKER